MRTLSCSVLGVLLLALLQYSSASELSNTAASDESAREAYRELEASEPRLSEADQRMMPYVLGLFVDGRTRDGKHVRLSVPVRMQVEPALQTRKGLFPTEADRAGRERLDAYYQKLEGIFSREFDRVSQQFDSTEYFQAAPTPGRRCNVGSAELCLALEQVWPNAVRIAMHDESLAVDVVAKWVNHFSTYDAMPARSFR